MAKGRKRKAGKRTKSGRLSRAKSAIFDKGTEHAQAMQARYGADGADAIGRAYRAGFLGEGAEAKAMLDTARKVANLYWQAYENGRYQCTLADRTGGGVAELDHDSIRRKEEWLRESLETVNRMGHDVRKAFDQLVVDVNPDTGPIWMDRLLWSHERHKAPQIGDMAILRKALDPLNVLANG